jgi:hypothetical protein
MMNKKMITTIKLKLLLTMVTAGKILTGNLILDTRLSLAKILLEPWVMDGLIKNQGIRPQISQIKKGIPLTG